MLILFRPCGARDREALIWVVLWIIIFILIVGTLEMLVIVLGILWVTAWSAQRDNIMLGLNWDYMFAKFALPAISLALLFCYIVKSKDLNTSRVDPYSIPLQIWDLSVLVDERKSPLPIKLGKNQFVMRPFKSFSSFDLVATHPLSPTDDHISLFLT